MRSIDRAIHHLRCGLRSRGVESAVSEILDREETTFVDVFGGEDLPEANIARRAVAELLRDRRVPRWQIAEWFAMTQEELLELLPLRTKEAS